MLAHNWLEIKAGSDVIRRHVWSNSKLCQQLEQNRISVKVENSLKSTELAKRFDRLSWACKVCPWKYFSYKCTSTSSHRFSISEKSQKLCNFREFVADSWLNHVLSIFGFRYSNYRRMWREVKFDLILKKVNLGEGMKRKSLILPVGNSLARLQRWKLITEQSLIVGTRFNGTSWSTTMCRWPLKVTICKRRNEIF